MAEQTTFPEPPDGHALLWPPRAGDELPVLIWRSDQLAEDLGVPEDRWHTPNSRPGASTTWEEACRIADANECPLSEAVVLAPAPERVGDHVREDGGYCRSDGTVHSPEEWARIAERAAAAAGVPEGVGASGD